MEVKYLGHSCFYIETNGRRLIIDPFISPNPLASHICVEDIAVDYILITHGHEDHIADVERVWGSNKGAKIIATYEIVSYFSKLGIEGHPMNLGGEVSFDFGKLKMVNALHSSSFPDGTYAGVASGFVLTIEGKNLYHAGDTALMEDMKQFAKDYAFDVVLLPIGDNFTMGMKDALNACDYLGVNKFIGMHFDTFPLIQIDIEKNKKLALLDGKELLILDIGEKLTF